MPLFLYLFIMLNKNIQKCQLKIVDQLDHVPPYEIFKEFKTNQKYSNFISNFVHMESKNIEDYFPQQEISQQDIQKLKNSAIFSARVILLAECFRLKTKDSQFQSICSLENKVYKRFIKLKDQYAERFLLDIGIVDKSLASNFRRRNYFTIQNYKFYKQKVEKLHQKEKDYRFLEDRHDYIQWMFPNHFQSMFNSDSWPMSYYEVQIFRKSRKLGLKILKSVRIFFDFLGIQLHSDYQYEIISKERLKQAIHINCHNHLRLRRVLACLSITGFRNIALSLIKFLGELVRTKTIYSKWKYTFEREWEIYGNKNIKDALKICFHPEDSFPETHEVWKQLRSQQGLNTQQQVAIDWNQYDQNSILKLTQILKTQTGGRYQMRNFEESSDEEQKDNKEQREEKKNQVKKQQNSQNQPEIAVSQAELIVNQASQAAMQQEIPSKKQNDKLNEAKDEEKVEDKNEQMVDQK